MIRELTKKYFHKRLFIPVLSIYLLFLLGLQISLHLKDYTRPFRKDFLFTLYYHSQWFNPESKYGIGDDGLYQVAGYTLATKNEFFTINPEMPPLAKYLYGYSILFIGNAEKTALLFYLGSLAFFYLILKKVLINKILIIFALLFFVTDKLIFSQSYITLLDLPQLLFFLAHVVFFLKLTEDNNQTSTLKRVLYTILTGVTFGFFISVKIALLAPLILLLDFIFLFFKKKIWYILPIFLFAVLIYMSTYIAFFFQGHTLVEFLKNQKWMLNFYLSSSVKPVFGTVISTLIAGKNIGWGDNSQWSKVNEWNISWPVYLISYISLVFLTISKKVRISYQEVYLLLLLSILLVAYCFLPFFTRYLVLILPLFIIFLFELLEKSKMHKVKIYTGIIILFCIHYYMFWT